MKAKTELTGKSSIVAFKIGRGGQFYNAGHKSYIGEYEIGHFTYDLFRDYENASSIIDSLKFHPNLKEFVEEYYMDPNEKAQKLFDKLGFDFGEVIYCESNGNPVGLTESDEESGIGCIDIDGDYDTTYTKYLHECDLSELKLIDNDNNDDLLIEYFEYYNEEINWENFNGEYIDLIEDFESGLSIDEYFPVVTYKIYVGDGVNHYNNESFAKKEYTDINDAAKDFFMTIKKHEKYNPYANDYFHEDFEPKQTDVYHVELQKFSNDKQIPFDDFYDEISKEVYKEFESIELEQSDWVMSYDFVSDYILHK